MCLKPKVHFLSMATVSNWHRCTISIQTAAWKRCKDHYLTKGEQHQLNEKTLDLWKVCGWIPGLNRACISLEKLNWHMKSHWIWFEAFCTKTFIYWCSLSKSSHKGLLFVLWGIYQWCVHIADLLVAPLQGNQSEYQRVVKSLIDVSFLLCVGTFMTVLIKQIHALQSKQKYFTSWQEGAKISQFKNIHCTTKESTARLCLIPSQMLPPQGSDSFSVPLYFQTFAGLRYTVPRGFVCSSTAWDVSVMMTSVW